MCSGSGAWAWAIPTEYGLRRICEKVRDEFEKMDKLMEKHMSFTEMSFIPTNFVIAITKMTPVSLRFCHIYDE